VHKEDNRNASRLNAPMQVWADTIALCVWLVAGLVAFLPFAFDTSPWDAIRLHVPQNQGNWWHLLAGIPFFLAYPMIWLRLRALFAQNPLTVHGRRLLWGVITLSIVGTVSVETPFLLHLAGTSEWQRLAVLSLGLGVIAVSALILLLRRRSFSPTQACVVGLETAYLANATLCLVVYSGASGGIRSHSGWLVTMLVIWPIVLELAWLLFQSFRGEATQTDLSIA
jgi:hypothetical protein